MGAHDKTFRALLKEKGVAEALLRERLDPKTVRRFAGPPEALPGSFIDAALRSSETDVLLRVPLDTGEQAFVYCLIEHKRTSESEVLFQLFRYQLAIYERLKREFRPGRIPMVVPIVVYNGLRAWRAPTRFRQLLHGPPELARWVADFGVVLVDLQSEAMAHLSRHSTLRGGFLALKVAASAPEERGELIREAVRSLGHDPSTLRLFLRYLLIVTGRAEFPLVKRTLLSLREGKGAHVQTIAQYLREQGYRQGRKRGLKVGLEQGLEQGREEGREEGREAALRAAVKTVLKTRFKKLPPHVDERLAAVGSAELEALLTQAAKARSLREVFAAN